MKDTEFECIEHGWRSHYQVCPFCMILVLQDDITKLKGKLQAAESHAASRLADQEAIERHTARRVAGEIAAMLTHDLEDEYIAQIDFADCFMEFIKLKIQQKYGVE